MTIAEQAHGVDHVQRFAVNIIQNVSPTQTQPAQVTFDSLLMVVEELQQGIPVRLQLRWNGTAAYQAAYRSDVSEQSDILTFNNWPHDARFLPGYRAHRPENAALVKLSTRASNRSIAGVGLDVRRGASY